jgi:hypothetical protein
MNAPSTGQLCRRCHRTHTIGIGVLMLTGITVASADSAPERFRVHATIAASPTVQTDTRFDLSARLTPLAESLRGGGYAISAGAIASPSVCSSDTIFINGFDL